MLVVGFKASILPSAAFVAYRSVLGAGLTPRRDAGEPIQDSDTVSFTHKIFWKNPKAPVVDLDRLPSELDKKACGTGLRFEAHLTPPPPPLPWV